MTKTENEQKIVIASVEDAVSISNKLLNHWFRGHNKAVSKLVPKVYREDYFRDYWPGNDLEQRLLQDFVRNAPSFESHLPNSDDHVSWLFLAQHYGLPTRLLDWSESILVALYFATERQKSDIDKEDGELWALEPYFLYQKNRANLENLEIDITSRDLATKDSLAVQYLADEAFLSAKGVSANDLLRDEKYKLFFTVAQPVSPIPLLPPLNFPRISSQMSAFTIHTAPYNGGKLLTDIFQTNEDPNGIMGLVRFTVPATEKETIQKDLDNLGINKKNLFQNLDALSETIQVFYLQSRRRFETPL